MKHCNVSTEKWNTKNTCQFKIIKLFICSLIFILKIKYIIFYLNSKNKVVLMKHCNVSKEKWNTKNTCQFKNIKFKKKN